MMCLPREIDLDRTVLETTAVQTSEDWWTGVVRDRDHETGEERIRLERLVANPNKVDMPHVWRVRPDFWTQEWKAVVSLEHGDGYETPGTLPIDDWLTPREYIPIRNNATRRVAVVRVQTQSGERVRLYHWDPDSGAVRQKFTTGQPWNELVDVANTELSQTA
jgi:hypothetical protein